MRGAHSLLARTLRQNRQRRDPGAPASRHKSTTVADRLPGRRFSVFLVSQVLVGTPHICHVERSRDISNCFANVAEDSSTSLGMTRQDHLRSATIKLASL